ncbi:MAG: hypothetical protein ACRDT2_22805 [Natronosporangium sp.]
MVAGQGRAGVTTTALAWAYARPGTVLVEADPAGGEVWAWQLVPDTGLSELAAHVLRHGEVTPEQLRDRAHPTGCGVPVVTAPAMGQGAAASVAATVEVLPKLSTEVDLVVDSGVVDLEAPGRRALLGAADRVLLLVVPTASGLARLADRLPALRQVCGERLQVAAVDIGWSGPPPHRGGEVSALLAGGLVELPYDPRTAGALAGRPGVLPSAGRRWGWWTGWRFPLLAAVTRL